MCQLLSRVWLCDPVDCSPPGSSVHGTLQATDTGVGCYVLLQQHIGHLFTLPVVFFQSELHHKPLWLCLSFILCFWFEHSGKYWITSSLKMVQFGNKNWHFSCCKGPTKWILRSKRKWEVKQTDGEHRWMCLQGTPLVSKGRNGWLGIQRTNTSSIITEREGRWKCKVWRWVAGKWCYLAKTIKVFSPESHQLTPGVCQTQVTCSYETIWHCRTAHTFDIFSKINLFFPF